MTLLDEAIINLEAVAKNKIEFVKNSCCCDDTEIEDEYIKSAEVHLQIAEWLKDYKRLIRQEPRCQVLNQKTESAPEIYWCDPEKNKTCRKTGCQKECFMTTKKEYAKTEEENE